MAQAEFISRFSESLIREKLQAFPIVMLEGPRQSGKTTLVKRFEREVGPYVSLDDDYMLDRAQLTSTNFIRRFDRGAIIDEVQAWPRIATALKLVVDESQGDRRFLITGSSAMRELRHASDTLAGRQVVLKLLTLSQAELCGGSPHLFLDYLLGDRLGEASKPSGDKEIFRRILVGGYPLLQNRHAAGGRTSWLSSYMQDIRQRDMPAMREVRADFDLERLLRDLAVRDGARLSVDAVRAVAEISHGTATKILAMLEKLNVIALLENYSPNDGLFYTRRLRKLHFNDTGMLSILLNLYESSFARRRILPEHQGILFESFVYSEIAKLCSAYSELVKIGFWHDSASGREVDLVVALEGLVTGVEITRAEFIRADDFVGLRKLAEAGPDVRRCILVYAGDEYLDFTHPCPDGRKVPMLALPVSYLWASEPDQLEGMRLP